MESAIATTAIAGLASLMVALVTAWFTRRNDKDNTALTLIDKYAKALEDTEKKKVSLETTVARLQVENGNQEDRIEALERSDAECKRRLEELEKDRDRKAAEITRLNVVIDDMRNRGTPSGGMPRP